MKKVLFVICVIALVGAGYFLYNGANSESLVRVALKWKHQAQFAGIYVGIEKGYYRENGLSVDLQEFDFGENPSQKLENGEADVAIMSAQEFVTEVSDGNDLVVVASIYQVSPYAVVSLSESGIKEPADFLGKRLGNKGGKSEERLFYIQLLKKVGLDEDDVQIIDLGFDKKEVDDLLDGDVDTVGLYRTDQLYFFERSGVKYNIIFPEKYGSSISNDVLVVKRELLDNRPEIVDAFVSGTIKGWEYAIQNIESAISITERYVVDENYKDTEYERYILEKSIPLIKTSLSQNIGRINIVNMQKLYESMFSSGIVTNQIDINNYLSNEFVDKI